jgi:hypothetical protein
MFVGIVFIIVQGQSNKGSCKVSHLLVIRKESLVAGTKHVTIKLENDWISYFNSSYPTTIK